VICDLINVKHPKHDKTKLETVLDLLTVSR